MDKEMRRTRWGNGTELPCSLGACHSPGISMCFPTWKLCKLHPLGVLWRFPYLGMVDRIIGFW